MAEKKPLKGDRGLFWLTCLLLVLGILALADVSSPLALSTFGDSFYFVKQQVVWGALGFVILLVSSHIHYSFWKKLAPVIFGVSIVTLIAVLLPGVGSKLLGARRWIVLGPLNFQPAELVKLSLAMFFAWAYDRQLPYWVYIVTLGALGGLIMLQPDLGTTLVVLSVGLIQLFLAGIPFLKLGGVLFGGGILGALLIMFSSYRRARLATFLQSSTDPLGSSYHIRQILIAIGSGGLFGVGLGQSRQKYLFLPETATDSIFAVIAEEIGFVGGVIFICLLAFFLYKTIKIARQAPDRFSMLLAAGVSAWLGGQMLLNIASMVSLTPLTGIPLPFFSYGGSSLIMILFAVGVLLNISKHAKN